MGNKNTWKEQCNYRTEKKKVQPEHFKQNRERGGTLDIDEENATIDLRPGRTSMNIDLILDALN